jgi:N-acetylneuraminic acid mutarotase
MKAKCVAAMVSLLGASAFPLTGAFAQDQKPVEQQNPTPPSAQSQPAHTAAINTLAGRIEKKSGRYVLMESASKSQYVLDDQKIAKRYEHRVVFVTGNVDMAAKTIHVQKIEVAA